MSFHFSLVDFAHFTAYAVIHSSVRLDLKNKTHIDYDRTHVTQKKIMWLMTLDSSTSCFVLQT